MTTTLRIAAFALQMAVGAALALVAMWALLTPAGVLQ